MSSNVDSMNIALCMMYLGVKCVPHAFNPNIAGMLHYNKVLLAALLGLTIVLSNAPETRTLRLVSAEKSKAFEHPLKIMLMLLTILVEISKQYSSK